MTRIFVYLLLGISFLVMQTALFPRILPSDLKPDLLLILTIYIGLNEKALRGGILVYTLGCFLDALSGNYPGLYGMVLLVIFLTVRSVVGCLNAESSILLLFMVGCGTLLEAALLIFPLGFFADAGALWSIVLPRLMPQALLNMAAAFLLLKGVTRLQKKFKPRAGIPGLSRLDSRYES
jgi:rod shape-determining protein MreD